MSYRKASDLVEIASLAASSRGVSLLDIQNRLGRHRRTAQRLIVKLEEKFPELEKIEDDDGRARWKLPRRSVIQLLEPTADELAALTLAVEQLRRDGATREAQAIRSLQAKILARIPDELGRRLEPDEEALLVAMGHAARPGPRPVSNDAVDAAIATALKGPQHLRIKYRSWSDNQARERIVAPHGLLLGVRRYLVAIDTAKSDEGIKHFRVEDIEEASVLQTSFSTQKGFVLDEHASLGFGSYQNNAEFYDVIWRFPPRSASRAARFIFHPRQKTKKEEDGSLLVTFSASGLLEMCWHLYMWGDAVEVVSPLELARMVEGHRRNDFASLP
ncbi:WYL domain-containing protein [Azospirillum sp. HJ39]|uniref:helix-turn-helix transcriptional regulator n=1 Tax=Azospirillum sp. HJ39 TaxID=3159496 RepID=UPI003556A1F8